MADYVQRSSGLLAACGAIVFCRGGSPHREVFEGGFPGTLELPGLLGNRAVFNSWLACEIGLGARNSLLPFWHPWLTDDGND